VLALAVSKSSGRAGGTGRGVATARTRGEAGLLVVRAGLGWLGVIHMGGGCGGCPEVILCHMSKRGRS
jgi:hypothetical protein